MYTHIHMYRHTTRHTHTHAHIHSKPNMDYVTYRETESPWTIQS